MSVQLLSILKYFLVALVWLFFLRVVRAVWVEVRRTRPQLRAHSPQDQPQPYSSAGMAPEIPLAGAVAGHAEPPRASPAGATSAPTTQVSRVAAADGWLRETSYQLEVLEPERAAGRRYSLGRESTVGRGAGCAISLADDSYVSAVHARLEQRDGALWVEDLGSTNGTWVAGRRISAPVELHPGDCLQIGRTVLEVVE